MSSGLTESYLQRFGGIARLYGSAALPRLAAAHVAVIGVGGVGSWTVEALARSGLGALTLIDLDDVCLTNTNRQLPALTSTVGQPKVQVLASRVREINPECRVTPVLEFFTASTAETLLTPRFDFVVDAVDRMSIKALILAEALKRGYPALTIGAAGGRCDPTQIQISDLGLAGRDELLRQVRKDLRRKHGFARGEGVNFGLPAIFSLEAPKYPWADGTCRMEAEPESFLKMDCASGFGAATHITAAFGFYAAGEVLRRLVDSTLR
jgi:tRNA A37 threonylcarbamoyladenosine dehydratase